MGTLIGQALVANVPTAGLGIPYSSGGVVTGLTLGTAYWFDINELVFTSGTVGLQRLTVILEEF